MRKTLIIGVVVVVVAVVLVVLVKGGGDRPAAQSGWSLIPGSVSVIGVLDVARLTSIPVVQGAINDARAEEGFTAFEMAGVAPDNMRRVFVGVDPEKALEGGTPDGVALVGFKTPLDESKLVEALEQEGAIIGTEEVKERTLYLLDAPEMESPLALVLLSNRRVAVGSQEFVHEVIRLSGGQGQAAADNRELMSLVGGTNQQGVLSIAAVVPEEGFGEFEEQAAASPIPPDQIKSVSFRLDYQDTAGLLLDLALNCRSPEVAAEATVNLAGMTGFATGMIGLPQEALSVTQEKSTIAISLALPRETMDSLAGSARQSFMPGPVGIGQDMAGPVGVQQEVLAPRGVEQELLVPGAVEQEVVEESTPVDEAARSFELFGRLMEGMSYEEVVERLETEGNRKAKAGNSTLYEWRLPGSLLVKATFVDDALSKWEAEQGD
jgi:hypothetical protein